MASHVLKAGKERSWSRFSSGAEDEGGGGGRVTVTGGSVSGILKVELDIACVETVT